MDASILECQSQIASSLALIIPDAEHYGNAVDVMTSDVESLREDIEALQAAVKRPQVVVVSRRRTN